MYDYVSLSTGTRLPSSSALVVITLGWAVDGSLVAALMNSIVTAHLVVDVGGALVAFGGTGAGSTGVLSVLAEAMGPTVVPSWESWSLDGASVLGRVGDW